MFRGYPFSKTTYYRKKKVAEKLGCGILELPDNRGKHKNHTKGENHPRKAKFGARHISSHGYVRVYVGKEHPLANTIGHAYEHVLVWVENGNVLPNGNIIHHIDGNKENNEIENLEIMTASEHAKHHYKFRKLKNGKFS